MSESREPFSFTSDHPELTYMHKLDAAAAFAACLPPNSPYSAEAIKNTIGTTPATIFSDEQADDEQTMLMWHHARNRTTRLPYTVIAGQQMDGWDTFRQAASFTNRWEMHRGNASGETLDEHTVRGQGFQIIKGGPMRDAEQTGKGLMISERQAVQRENEALSQEAAERVSRAICAPYIAHVWTSLNTFARLSDTAKDLCKIMVFTCPITAQTNKHSAGWNLASDLPSWRATYEYFRTHKDKKLVLVRGRYCSVRADHQKAFDQGEEGYEQLLQPSFRIHRDDKASFVRVKDKVMSENLEQMCGALSFLTSSDTMVRPRLKEGSSLQRLIREDAWTKGYSNRASSVFLARHIVANNPYLDTMGDPFGLVLSHPDVQLIPVSINTDDPYNIDISPLEDGEKPFVYLAVAPRSFHDTFLQEFKPPVHAYRDIAGSTDEAVPLVDEAAASEWPEYCEVMSELVRACKQALPVFSGDELTDEHRSEALSEYDNVLSDFEKGTMTRVCRGVMGRVDAINLGSSGV